MSTVITLNVLGVLVEREAKMFKMKSTGCGKKVAP